MTAPATDRKVKPWHERRFLGLDFESTDKDPLVARIVSAAMVIVNATGNVEASWYTLVRQDGPIPEEATKIHGITTEQCQLEGQPLAIVLHQLAEHLAWAAERGVPVVIFNVKYDWSLLYAESQRCAPPASVPDVLLLDPLVIDRHLDRWRKGSRKLDAVARQHGLDPDSLDGELHDARKDAALAARTMRRIALEYFSIQASRLEDLQRAQPQWFAEWHNHYQAYRQVEFQDNTVPDERWPR